MLKFFASFMIFVVGMGVSMTFQNCGGSSLKANSSDNDNLRVEVLNEDATSGDDDDDGGDGTGGETGEFSFNLNDGDNIFFVKGGGLSLDLATSRILAKVYYSMIESHVFEQRGVTFQRDLPSGYCKNSALPHCEHLSTAPCVGLGCFKGPSPVRCHWQKRMSTAEINNTFTALNSIEFLNRSVSATDPMISDCNNPMLYFYKTGSSLELSLANPACVPHGQYYAANESGNNITAIFNNEIDEILALTDNSGGSEYCNNYSAFSWDTTKFIYRAFSGFVRPEDSYRYEVSYEARQLMIQGQLRLVGAVDMIFKEPGDATLYCANNVPVQDTEIEDILFPSEGFLYEILRTNTAIADLSTAEITFEDPVDGGNDWRFFLDRGSALTATGGPIMIGSQADAIKNIVQTVLVNRAKVSGLANPCPPN